MNNHALHNYQFRLFYTGIWVLITCIQILVLYLYSGFSWKFILSDACVFNVLLSGCIIALWYPVRYNRNMTDRRLFILFHILLATITLFCWLGGGFLLMNLFTSQDTDYQSFYFYTIPLRIILGLFIYTSAVLSYYLLMYINEVKELAQKQVQADEETLSRIAIKRRQEIQIIPVDDVMYLEAEGDYVQLYTPNGHFLKEKTMKYWESHLPSDRFIRIHRSYIVNVQYVNKIEIYEKESYRIYLKNGIFLKASSSGYKLLKQMVQL